MILHIITETRENYEKGGGHPVKLRLEKISGQPCLVQYYADVTPSKVKRWGIRAVVFGGYGTALNKHKLETFQGIYELAREGEIPMIGFCGGHQLIAELWAEHNDRKLTRMASYPIRKLRKHEPDYNPSYHPGQFKEWGFHPIRVVRKDPLFRGLPNPFMACEQHMREVKKLPRDFVLLASTKEVRVQAYRHKSRLIYGTQFHCENYTDHYPAGKKAIQNFFKIAGII